MTAPLTPPESDLQDFPFMPLHVARLRDSDLAGEESPEACWYAVLLWAASWHQLPAGSLPDNDAVLARLVGLGRDLRTFRKHKAAAMRGFILCDDGRLYHPVVAEQVTAGWNSKLQQRWRTECARIKKANQRNGTDLPLPTFEEFMSLAPIDPGPEVVPRDKPISPSGQGVQETGTGTGNLFEGADAPIAEIRPTKVDAVAALVERLWAFQPMCGGKRKATRPEVSKALTAALKRGGDPASIEAAFRTYYALPDCQRDGGQFAKGAAVLLNDDKWRDFVPGAGAAQGSDWPDSRWAMAVEMWRADGSWGESLGPKPGEPACRVPPHLLIQKTAQGSAA